MFTAFNPFSNVVQLIKVLSAYIYVCVYSLHIAIEASFSLPLHPQPPPRTHTGVEFRPLPPPLNPDVHIWRPAVRPGGSWVAPECHPPVRPRNGAEGGLRARAACRCARPTRRRSGASSPWARPLHSGASSSPSPLRRWCSQGRTPRRCLPSLPKAIPFPNRVWLGDAE